MGETLAEQTVIEVLVGEQAKEQHQTQVETHEAGVEHIEQVESQEKLTHVLKDGSVVEAGSIDEIMEKCPAMAGMSHRQVAMTIKMQARGRERLAKQVTEKAAAQPKPEDKPSQRQGVKSTPQKVVTPVEHKMRHVEANASNVQQVELAAAVAEQALRRRGESTQIQEVATQAKAKSEYPKPPAEKLAKVIDIKTRREIKPWAPKTPVIEKPTALTIKPKTATATTIRKKPQPARVIVKPMPSPKKPEVLRTVTKEPRKVEIPEAKPVILESSELVPKKPELRLVPADNTWFEEVPQYRLAEAEPLSLVAEAQEEDQQAEVEVETETAVWTPDSIVPELRLVDQAPSMAEQPAEGYHQVAVDHVIEVTAVSQKVAEQATTLLIVMPESVQAGLAEYIHEGNPADVEEVESKVTVIAEKADRLHELVGANEIDSEKIEQIERELIKNYTELLTTLGVEFDDETIESFIRLIKSEDYIAQTALLQSEEFYDPMKERQLRQDLSMNDQNDVLNLVELAHSKLAKLMVRHSLASAA